MDHVISALIGDTLLTATDEKSRSCIISKLSIKKPYD